MATDLIVGNKQTKKTMAGQFLSSHQRFFNYLCITSKEKHFCQVAEENQRMGKCIAIGLTIYCSTGQSTVASQPASQPACQPASHPASLDPCSAIAGSR